MLLKSVVGFARNRGTLQCVTRLTSAKCSSFVNDDDFHLQKLEGDQTGIAVFSMRRHKAKNAFSRNMVTQLRTAMESVKFDKEVRVVIVRSEVPGVFCAGADLKERLTMTQEEAGAFVSSIRRMTMDIEDLPMPVIAAIDGAALGGGLELALACDLRTAADSAKVGLVETRLAIIPGGGGTQRLPRLIGPALAKELVFTARILNGGQAADIGLVNHSVPQNENNDAAYQRAVQLAEEIIPNGPIGVRMAKAAISKGMQVDIMSGLAVEQGCYAQVIPTKDRIEGLKAFKEKRKPQFKGE